MNETSSEIETRTILTWWNLLYPSRDTERPGDAGARASMRRAGSPEQVLLLPAFHMLLRRMRDNGLSPAGFGDAHLRRLAVAAAVICECHPDRRGKEPLCQVLGAGPSGGNAPLSALRFQSLMAAMDRDDGADQMTALRRALSLAKREPFSVPGLVRDILSFSDKTRIRWTFDYFGTRREAPADDSHSDTEETPQ